MTVEGKRKIVLEGVPKPPLIIPYTTKTGGSGTFKHNSSSRTDNKLGQFNWLTGSQSEGKLFCYHCLCFPPENGADCFVTGFTEFSRLSARAQRHENTLVHLNSSAAFKRFPTATDAERAGTMAAFTSRCHTEYNAQVERNRDYMRREFDVTITIASLGIPFRGHTEGEESANRGCFVEISNLVNRARPIHLKDAFTGLSSTIQNELIQITSDAVINNIKNMVEKCEFFSVMADEATDASHRQRMSVCLRFVFEGELHEEFLGLSNVSATRGAEDLSKVLIKILASYNPEMKIVGQVYDGAYMMSGIHKGLQKLIRDKFPEAIYVHCAAHRASLALEQGMRAVVEIEDLFTKLSVLSSFFTCSYVRSSALGDVPRPPDAAATRWATHSKLVNNMLKHRKSYIGVFSKIQTGNYDPVTKCKAKGIQDNLDSFDMVSTALISQAVFVHTDILFQVFQGVNLDIIKAEKAVERVAESLINARSEEKCRELFEALPSNLTGYPEDTRKRKRPAVLDDYEVESGVRVREPAGYPKFSRIYFDVVDNVLGNMSTRFSSLPELRFFHF
eukprot:sb/3463531/